MPEENGVFLSAEWRDLVMLNYEVDRTLLEDYVPPGTVLDSFEGRTYVTLVAFQFRHTKLFGSLAIPFHANFDEINLRFYVRRNDGNEDRRGVVFIAEIVPRWAVAKFARLAYGENYVCLPMKHRINMNGAAKTAEYGWQLNGAWCRLFAETSAVPTHRTAAWSNSLPSTIGAIPPSAMETPLNTMFRMCLGMFGRVRLLDSKEIPAAFMD